MVVSVVCNVTRKYLWYMLLHQEVSLPEGTPGNLKVRE